MKPALILGAVAALAIACSSSQAEPPSSHTPARERMDSPTKAGPILVELFTSQGCSSCPPADVLLPSLDAAVEAEVIALAYHVDYWNYIGWKDPYSAKRWSERQRAYAKRLARGRSYTPQLVVAGSADAVGSRVSDIKKLLEAESKRAPSGIALSATIEAAGARELVLQIEADIPKSARGLKLSAALYESDLHTEVLRGENRGRSLRNDFVVRQLEESAALEPGPSSHQLRFSLETGWKPDALGVVVFVQDPQSMRILQTTRAER